MGGKQQGLTAAGQPGQSDIWNLIDLYFKEKHVLYQMHYNSFNQFIEETVFSELQHNPNVIHESVRDKKVYRYRFVFDNIVLKAPADDNNDEIMFPKDARMKHVTYAGKLMADVKQVQEMEDIETGAKEVKVLFQDRILVAKIPIMVRSKYCSTNIKRDVPDLECPYDPGCYFIVKGSEKVVISHERICENKMLVFTKKEANYPDGLMHYVQVNSRRNEDPNANLQITSVKVLKDRSIVMTTPHFSDIPVFIFFRALGLVTDYDIINYIAYDEGDIDLINVIKPSLNSAMKETFKDDTEAVHKIRTQEDAIQYLITKMKTSRRYNETDAVTRNMQKREHLMSIFEDELLPHMGKGMLNKAIYLGLMCNRLLECVLGRTDPDDRDSYVNKRIDLPGVLMGQLFKQYYKKMLNECSKTFKKRMGGNTTDANPINVISQIKSMTIEQGFNSALATGTWGSSKRKGVAQMLQRLTYMYMISYFRRVITPAPDASTSKMDKMRYVHSGQYGFIDAVETPEGEKVGLHKHLALTASISINSRDQPKIIKDLISDRVLFLSDDKPVKLKMLTKVFINGEWYAMSDRAGELAEHLREMRRNGSIDKMVGIVHHMGNKELRINTDGGRLYRPLLRVRDNQLVLQAEHLHKLETWNGFLSKHPGVLEYVDIEEAENLMIAMTPHVLLAEREKMLTPVADPHPNGNVVNRYASVYRRFTHCELHPSMMLGSISSNIPFSEHNQSPRNYYNFAQARQGMGINASNLRHRMDLTYLLYHPQTPLVQTRAAKYTHMLNLPAGENVVVAIASYTGYNQEDSIVINKSAVDRGLFRATYFNKVHDVIQKNPQTSQDDKFSKPDPNQTFGMQNGNYEKLNANGYVEEETTVEYGDFIIGKVTPTQPKPGDSKIYKDSSTKYKSMVPGVVDKVFTGIYNAENYEMYNMKLRSERVPRVGDKLCSRHG
jgi:DNA-directed RNA polymerase II subunit RPB2